MGRGRLPCECSRYVDLIIKTLLHPPLIRGYFFVEKKVKIRYNIYRLEGYAHREK